MSNVTYLQIISPRSYFDKPIPVIWYICGKSYYHCK